MTTPSLHPLIVTQARSLRASQTPAQQILWNRLRAKRFCGLKFRRQDPIGMHIVDFCCKSQKLVIEIKTDPHGTADDRERRRELQLRRSGYRILRFSERQILTNLPWVLDHVSHAVNVEMTSE